jgi:flagellar biosynthesis protein FlhG
MIQRFRIKQVAKATGLEESEIRFYEQVFREFLTFSEMALDKNEFSQDHIDVLARIKRLIHDEGQTLEEVRRQLKSALAQRSAAEASVAELGTAQTQSAPAARAGRFARVIGVTSGKGGVGKTTLTVNLAIQFARMGKKVAIFDADLGLANVHILMGVKPKLNLRHMIEDNFSLEDCLTQGPEGVQIISGGQGVREMANLTAEQRRRILREMDRLEREVDILLIDTGAGISENVLRFATFADEVVVVTSPNIAAAADAYSIIKILLEMEPNAKVGVIPNMVQNIYHSKNVFNRISAAARKYLNYDLGDLGCVVTDPRVESSCQARTPLMIEHPNSEAAKCIRAIAETILNTNVFINERKDSSFGDLMGALKRTVAGV